MPRLLTVAQAAAEIGVSQAKLWQWISAGRIGSLKVDGSRRLTPDQIDEFIAGLTNDRPARRKASV
jgi:excisionase family DNA binding protein